MNRSEFKKLTAIEKIKALTGIFSNDPKAMMDKLALINLIARVETGDAELGFLNEMIDKRFEE